jgi:site-specific DNA-methyltransferase (adenine-specific)
MTAVLPRPVTEQVSVDAPVTLLHGAVEDALKLVPTNSCDAVVTDPPYALDMGGGTEGWDSYSMAEFESWCELWGREMRRIVKPGGWMISFGSGRTWHRMTCGFEDAGWDIVDSINWMYPSGFVRSINIGERLLKAGEIERAAQVAGRGTMPHSRHEPAILARCPLEGSLVNTVAKYGTGTIDMSVGTPNGGAPTNVLAQHSPLCGGENDGLSCVPGCPIPELGPNARYFHTFRFEGKPSNAERPLIRVEPGEGVKDLSSLGKVRAWTCSVCHVVTQSYMGKGSKYANRPHPVCDHDSYVPMTDNWSSVIKHNTVKPLNLMRFLVRLLTLPGAKILEPFAGSGSTVEAALLEGRSVVAVERDLKSLELCRLRLRRQGCYNLQSDET